MGLALIECVIDRDNCTKELLEWGNRVVAANSRLSCIISGNDGIHSVEYYP